jgi:aspartate aminotransferase
MPHISQRAIVLPPSPIRRLVPYAEAAKKKGTRVLHLNIGQPDIATPQSAVDAVHCFNEPVYEYSHSAGNESYRRALARYYERVGIEVKYNEILATVGGSEALVMAMNVCMEQWQEILVPEPFYANYYPFAMEAGVIVRPIPSYIENDFALPPIEEFERHITPLTKAILICNPNNPTGYLYSKEELEQLRDIIKRHDLFLISDEVYREFCYDGAVHHSVMNLKGIEQNTVMVDSVSKRYSMCGVRLGALVSHNADVVAATLKIAQARLSPPLLAQVAAEAAIETPASYFEEVNREYTLRRNCIVELLNKIPGVYCPMPRGAFYAVVQLPVDDADKFAQWLLEEFTYKGATVMLAPASGFYASPRRGRDQVRIAYVLKREDLTLAAECLAEALKVYPGRTK